jgi:hypothetical protein
VNAALRSLAVMGVAALAAEHHRVRETGDIDVLPPPEQVVSMSLGYRSALADVLWANTLVAQGLHLQEHRHYEVVSRLLDTINTLDPGFRAPYRYADALITFQVGATTHEEVVAVRKVLERGAQNLPLDPDIWLDLGSFVSFVAPGTYLTDPEEKKQWRLDGLPYLARAAELAGDNASIAWRALGGANAYGRAGETEAEIRFLRRSCAVTDDPELKIECEKRLGQKLSKDAKERYDRREQAFQAIWKSDLRYVSVTRLLVLGPPRDVAYCAGRSHDDLARCAATWRDWAERTDPLDLDLAARKKP